MDIFDFLILAFATWRLSYLLVQEDGPYHLFTRIRTISGITYWREQMVMGEGGKPTKSTIVLTKEQSMEMLDDLIKYNKEPNNEIAKALTCIYCTSIWVSLTLVSVYYFIPTNFLEPFMFFNYWLAVGGLAMYIQKR